MKIHIRDYVAQRKAELDAFEKDWYEHMESEPDNYRWDTDTYQDWAEQEEAFLEMRREDD